jgi:predicted transcriptional regulator
MVRRRLQKLLTERDLKVIHLAYLSDVSDATIYNILNGADPKLSTIARIARALGLKTSDLIDNDEADEYIESVKRIEGPAPTFA